MNGRGGKTGPSGESWRVLHYPPHPPYGNWLSVDAIEAYEDEHRGSQPARQAVLERIATREAVRPVLTSLASRLSYLGWSLLFGIAADAVLMPYDDLHGALQRAGQLRDDIVTHAEVLAGLIDEYRSVCTDGKIDNHSIYLPRDLPDQLIALAAQLRSLQHDRIGVGKAAWSSRVRAASVPPFVRYFDARIASYVSEGSSTGGLTVLSPVQMAKLTIAALPLRDDALSSVTRHIRNIRKSREDSGAL
jgi:hypothetical protein